MPIFLALIIVPLIEIALFIEVGGLIGLWPTLGIVVLTALAGATMLRVQGLATIGDLKGRIDRGQDPSGPLAHGALILASGLLLLTPGFFTDGIGFALLVPQVRAAVIRYLARRVVTVIHRRGGQPGDGPGAGPHPGRSRGPGTVEGDYEVVDPEVVDPEVVDPEEDEDKAGRDEEPRDRRAVGRGR
jgi:UPF0716 protein FxsA